MPEVAKAKLLHCEPVEERSDRVLAGENEPTELTQASQGRIKRREGFGRHQFARLEREYLRSQVRQSRREVVHSRRAARDQDPVSSQWLRVRHGSNLGRRPGLADSAQHVTRSLSQQALRDAASQSLGRTRIAEPALSPDLPGVGIADDGRQAQTWTLEGGVPSERNGAPCSEPDEQRSLGPNRHRRRRVIEWRQEISHPGIVGAAFETEDALPHRRNEVLEREQLGSFLGEAEPTQACQCQHDRIQALGAFQSGAPQPGGNVAADGQDLEVSPLRAQLNRAAER
jgi:hypothetical protein